MTQIKNMKPVTIVDSIMGSGKTSWAMQYMKDNPTRHYIFVTPFLDEVTRIKNALPELCFFEPDHRGGRSKLESFNDLLMDGRNIVTTHKTFSNATNETIDYIRHGNYVLILDEVLDILLNFSDATGDDIERKDIEYLLDKHSIEVDSYSRVRWVDKDYSGGKYTSVQRTAENGTLYLIDGTLLIWSFPEKIFRLFDDVFVLTYLFAGSYLKPFFEYHGIPFQYKSVSRSTEGYELCEPKSDVATRGKYKDLIDLCDVAKMNCYDASALSKSWFERTYKKDHLKALQRQTQNYFQHITKAKSSEILWTCIQGPKDRGCTKGKFLTSLSGKGYTKRPLTPAEKELPPCEQEKLKRDCFLPCNARATNDYGDRSVLAYLFNMFPNPYVKRFFEQKNDTDGTDIHVDEDKLALACMLQWIWRSRIRNGQPIKIWIPSTRMRNLLCNWLAGA